MIYQLEQYYPVDSDRLEFQNLSSEIREKIAKAYAISKKWTIENQTAKEIDDKLFPIVHFQFTGQIIEPKTNEKTMEDLKRGFSDLFENLQKVAQQTGGQSLNKSKDTVDWIKSVIYGEMSVIKISEDHLDRELKEKLNKVQKIQYQFEAKTTSVREKSTNKFFQQIIDQIMLKQNIFFVGGAGTGKTYLANEVAKALELDAITINCSQWTSPTEIIGGDSIDGWREGKLIDAWKNGKVLILDEMPKLDANTAGLFNEALSRTQDKDYVIYDGKGTAFKKHDNFCAIATGNIYPNAESMAYGANNKQDLSLLDRFVGGVYWIEKDPETEKFITQNNVIWKFADKLRSVIEEMKYEAVVSLRFMIACRDVFKMQKKRYQNKGKDGVKWNEGVTVEKFVESFFSTFTKNQIDILKEKTDFKGFLFDINAMMTE